ncbi:YbaB/EbfC family nucleoid-associated protein [Neptunicoccus cionae]|uniref:Nucleoid-associated protein GCM10011498_12420 n=1 Tax=Neptunicoccus cionae TaxID=2035344 RepID=A0A916VPG1_9RHOB|nr:YbaB/EbfC family nucleoid-associated protein [Amylibacter cionae]GGA13887.1 nucleoid-associated protein YbaB [Amylibacter cionae]
MLKGLGGLGDMAKIMKQAQEMQGKMAEAQAKLDEITVEGEAGAGMVKVTVTAKGDVKGINIDPSLFVADDKEVVEDLIVAAIKDGQARAAETAQAEMGKVTEGLNLPEGMKLPF